jgi:hypothetical protein
MSPGLELPLKYEGSWYSLPTSLTTRVTSWFVMGVEVHLLDDGTETFESEASILIERAH